MTAKIEFEQTEKIRTIGGIGIYNLSKELLERWLNTETKLNIFVVGSCIIDKNIDLDLFNEVVVSVKVYGILRGPQCRYVY